MKENTGCNPSTSKIEIQIIVLKWGKANSTHLGYFSSPTKEPQHSCTNPGSVFFFSLKNNLQHRASTTGVFNKQHITNSFIFYNEVIKYKTPQIPWPYREEISPLKGI